MRLISQGRAENEARACHAFCRTHSACCGRVGGDGFRPRRFGSSQGRAFRGARKNRGGPGWLFKEDFRSFGQGFELEKRLAAVRGRTAGAESVSVRLGEKQGAYEGLRAEAALLAGALSEAGAGPRPFVSAEPSAFLSDLENLELASRRAAFSIEVLEKMLPDGGAERVLSEVSAGKGPIVRIDPSLGKVSRLRGRTVLGEISAGGVWMYPILAFGLAALLTASAKAAVSMRVRRLPDGLVGAVVSRLESGDAAGAMAAAESAPAPYARLLSFFVKTGASAGSFLRRRPTSRCSRLATGSIRGWGSFP